MNFNANSGQRQTMGRKIKRVSDINAMGVPAQPVTPQPFNPYNPSFQNTEFRAQPPVYTDLPGTAYSPASETFPNASNTVPMQPSQYSMLAQPVVQDMAYTYGQQLASQGKQLVKTEIERYVPVTRLKYYFAVDTKYVLSKLKLLVFPFTHSDWSIKYQQDNPVQPRFELNAPDLYIPTMAYVTYVLVAGLVLGMQNRFSPEQIGIQASSALAWSIVEIAIYTATLYITNIRTTLKTFDLLAYSGYKYIGIILSILLSVLFSKTGYYCSIGYCGLALAFFLVRTLKAQVLPESEPTQDVYYGAQTQNTHGAKRRLYFLLFVAIMQPILSWWLTFHLIEASSVAKVATA